MQQICRIGYSKFNELAIYTQRITSVWIRGKEQQMITVVFENAEISTDTVVYVNSDEPITDEKYNSIVELSKRYTWIDVPEVIYYAMREYMELNHKNRRDI